MIEPYLKDLDPQTANFMRMQVLSGGNGMIPGLLGSMEPNAERNVVASSIPKDQWDRLGLDPGLDPNTPLIIEKSKLNPNHIVTARVLSVPLLLKPNDQGEMVAVNPRTLQQSKPIEGLTAPGSNSLRQPRRRLLRAYSYSNAKATFFNRTGTGKSSNPPGSIHPSSRRTKPPRYPPPASPRSRPPAIHKKDLLPKSAGIPPVASGSGSSDASDHSQTAVNYRAWVDGKASLSEKEQASARAYADQHHLPLPSDTLSSRRAGRQ